MTTFTPMPTFTTTLTGNGSASRKVGPPTSATVTATRLEPAQGNLFQDLNQGCAAGATITGPTRSKVAGKDLVVTGQSTAAGRLIVEGSTDSGATWTVQDSDPVLAAEYVQSRATIGGSITSYRIKFVCGPVAASKVQFFSQSRS